MHHYDGQGGTAHRPEVHICVICPSKSHFLPVYSVNDASILVLNQYAAVWHITCITVIKGSVVPTRVALLLHG